MVLRDRSCLSRHLVVAIIRAGTTGQIHLMGLSCLYPSSDALSPNHSRPQRENAGRLTPKFGCKRIKLKRVAKPSIPS